MDILKELAEVEHIHQAEIISIIKGSVFLMASRNDGGHGLCAMPDAPCDVNSYNDYITRVELQANLNAAVNKRNLQLTKASDPLSQIRSGQKFKISLIGFIESIYFRLVESGHQVSAFDLVKTAPELTPIHLYEESIRQADYVLATGTSITNNSISEYSNWIREYASLLIIGPSTPLSAHLFEMIKPLKGLYGSIIIDPTTAANLVKEGFGTRMLGPYMKKAALTR